MKYACCSILALLVAFAGCETPMSSAVAQANQKMEAKGSPFRYVAQDGEHMALTLMPLPAGPTRAVPPLARQAMDAITTAEFKKGRSIANLQEVRYLPDGREVWVLQTLGDGVAYIVAFANAAQGGSDIRVTGPTVYTK